MKNTMAPFRELLRPSAAFYWDERLQKLLEEAREEIVTKVEAGVKMFEMDKVTCLATDWSKKGVGFFMFQKNCDCQTVKIGCCKDGWQVVLAWSRFLRKNEKNCCLGEGEGLAVVYALTRQDILCWDASSYTWRQIISRYWARSVTGIWNRWRTRDYEG